MQPRNADQHPCHQFAEEGGPLEAHHQRRQGPGGEQDHDEAAHLDQGLGRFDLAVEGPDALELVVAPVLQQPRRLR